MNTRTIAAAALAASVLIQTQGFAQNTVPSGTGVAPPAADPEAVARESWRSFMAKNPSSEKGCFHVAYPNYVWQRVNCREVQVRAHPIHVNPSAVVPDVVGNDNDYAVVAKGLITSAVGSFSTSGVDAVTSVGVAAFGNGGIHGSNEYSLQINTNNNVGYTSACAYHGGCHVWQQFVYATDQDTVFPIFDVGAGLFIQYWLLGWNDSCPSGWQSSTRNGQTDCFKNSSMALLPDIPITDLNNLKLTGFATPGGIDIVTLTDGAEAWSVSADDSVLQIGTVWTQAEFNVVGDGGGSQAQFNDGASISVQLAIADGSDSAPACLGQSGTTGETNNLNLGATCQVVPYGASAVSNTDPYDYHYAIEFTESLPAVRYVGGCLVASRCTGTLLQ